MTLRKAFLLLVGALFSLTITAACGGAPATATPTEEEMTAESQIQATATSTSAPQPTTVPTSAPVVSEEAGGTLTVGTGAPIINVDPGKDSNTIAYGLFRHVAETLVSKDDEGNIVPLLATDWEVSEDGITWTFSLHEDVVFHDGAPFNAEAVAKSFNRVLNEDNNLPRRRFISAITSVEAANEYQVVFRTEEPSGVLLNMLTDITAAVISPNLAESTEFDNLIGTGPFMMESWEPDQETVLVRNPNYWGEPAKLERLIYLEVPEASTRVSMLETGEIDVDLNTPPDLVQQFEGVSEFEVISRPGERGLTLDLVVTRPPFDDLRVREAVLHAINVDEIIDGVLFGQAVPLQAFPGCAQQVTGCIEIQGYQDYDPEKSRQLLEEAGYPDGLDVELVYGTPRYVRHTEILTAIQAQLAEVGIRMELTALEWGQFIETVTQPFEEVGRDLTSWAFNSGTGDVSNGLNNRLRIDNQPPGCCNVTFYTNEQVDQQISDALSEVDTERRLQLLREAQQSVAEDMPIIYILRYNLTIVQRANVTGAEYAADEQHSFRNAAILAE